MPALIAMLVALIASAAVAKSVSLVLDDWIWLSVYSLIVPTAIAVVGTRVRAPGIGEWRYLARISVGTIVGSALGFSVVQALNGYMELPGWHLFIAIFPVTVVVGSTGALIYGLGRYFLLGTGRATA